MPLHKCEVCGRVLKKPTKLGEHMRTHTGEQPYECDICGTRFARSYDLTKHKELHTGQYKYRCEGKDTETTWGCGKAFHKKGDLNRHLHRKNAKQCHRKPTEITLSTHVSVHASAFCVNTIPSQSLRTISISAGSQTYPQRESQEADNTLTSTRDKSLGGLFSTPSTKAIALSEYLKDSESSASTRVRSSESAETEQIAHNSTVPSHIQESNMGSVLSQPLSEVAECHGPSDECVLHCLSNERKLMSGPLQRRSWNDVEFSGSPTPRVISGYQSASPSVESSDPIPDILEISAVTSERCSYSNMPLVWKAQNSRATRISSKKSSIIPVHANDRSFPVDVDEYTERREPIATNLPYNQTTRASTQSRTAKSSHRSLDYVSILATDIDSLAFKLPTYVPCRLCPELFVSHLAQKYHEQHHSDEWSFTCWICGKIFFHQLDQKRHETLHSCEDPYTCRGGFNSKPGVSWGCGRRFVQAYALGVHFRTTEGRGCIMPLLDEEAVARQWNTMKH